MKVALDDWHSPAGLSEQRPGPASHFRSAQGCSLVKPQPKREGHIAKSHHDVLFFRGSRGVRPPDDGAECRRPDQGKAVSVRSQYPRILASLCGEARSRRYQSIWLVLPEGWSLV